MRDFNSLALEVAGLGDELGPGSNALQQVATVHGLDRDETEQLADACVSCYADF